MSCNQNFLENAKIFINSIDGSNLWLVDTKAKLASRWGLSSFIEQDFSTLETPSDVLYQDFIRLMTKECPSLVSTPYVATEVQKVTFVNQVAIQQRLSNALPLLASLIEGDAILKAVGQRGDAPEDLVKRALRYVDILSTEVQK